MTEKSTLDAVFESLQHPRRRYTLYYLNEHEHTDAETLAAAVASWEQDEPIEAIDDDRQQQVLADLYHNHFPQLQTAGFIEYDDRSGAIRYRDPPAVLADVLEICTDVEQPV